MRVGIPKEIKNHEYRVALSPAGVREVVATGAEVLVETHAGVAVGYSDDAYRAAGARIVPFAHELYKEADMVVKVKEPQSVECDMLREGQVLFSYLHLAPDPQLTQRLINNKCVGIAFETVTGADGSLPLLAPMSEVAGRMAIQAGMHCLEKRQGGSGVLLPGVPGVAPGKVVVLGGGVVGTNAAFVAAGAGAQVTILEKSPRRIRQLCDIFGSRLTVLAANMADIEQQVASADLLVGAVLIPGAAAPRLVTRAMLKSMRPGSVAVDVAIDQGGCFETSRPTSHEHPTYVEEGVVHYCVTNIPGAVARTSSRALENAILPYVVKLAKQGWKNALLQDEHLRAGLNVALGHVTYGAVATDTGHKMTDPAALLAA